MKDFLKDLDSFVKQINRVADGELKRDMAVWLEATGFQFLEEIQREIIRLEVVDTRRLLTSFTKGDSGNVWQITKGGLSLEIGTNVDYARFVEEGHAQSRRWLPGRWEGGSFVYDKDAKTGMMLKAKWIEGRHYFDNALSIFEEIFGKSLERNLDHWIERLVGGRM
ncbi:HK97 gp10 family phage protein [Aneurinibacillus migulanus]|uniref:Bacteriophage HK97-gp10, putative tail-component n=1 Tax=Aneurinibacillus migulanus TaxID=47500 RepID=A0A0D1Y757_ANEMI|nr:HK97 gp10 family phage protein [Aneurinibacillus migulanus]KIV60283.1 phage portal protein [Aneurinibacillus migulanus]KON90518.1 phage portal protein [Aneurinibacillus migulanus]MED0894899.1 HK97 gp10 family phage protein [Aneurinibacillus migulanus]MED1614458.1 HK97 gp10 family phage protein [Aneurinibacillus migulanus]SDJ77138.1 Bacteriophage HK97-gp10, putative tail-component [Aneurinibacillus migulanus]